MSVKYIFENSKIIHAENVERGWWKNPRNAATFVCLFHSEVSEGVEGIRKDLPDDKLTHYPMIAVELADCIIRCCDYIGYLETTSHYVSWDTVSNQPVDDDMMTNLAEIHSHLTAGWEFRSEGFLCGEPLVEAASLAYNTAIKFGWDIEAIIEEKRAFNGVRPDHQLEVRESGEVGTKRF